MGEARNRGTREERRAQSIERERLEAIERYKNRPAEPVLRRRNRGALAIMMASYAIAETARPRRKFKMGNSNATNRGNKK